MKESVAIIFQTRFLTFQEQAQQLQKKYNWLSGLRIIFFLVAVIGIVYLANARLTNWFIATLILSVVGFVVLVTRHQRIKRQLDHTQRLTTINSEETERLNYHLHAFDAGLVYQDSIHPYSGDLDVFGEHSLFQLINRSNTQKGKDFLADWLQHPANKKEVELRQAAVQELSPQIDWRQSQQAHSRVVDTKAEDIKELLNWVATPAVLSNQTLYRFIQAGLAAATVVTIGLSMAGLIHWYVPMLLVVVNFWIIGSKAKIAMDVHEQTKHHVKALKAYRYMMEGVEKHSFQSARLQSLQDNLLQSGRSASQFIKELEYILSNFDSRANMLYHVFNFILLLDIYWLLRADHWKTAARDQVGEWLDSMGEIEAINSVASFAFAQPEFTFPLISDERHHISAEEMGHCLIPPTQRVNNNFGMEGRGAINVITGSNMSGKSTFLRTVGTNVVLALMGAPVCAQRFEVGVMQVFTSMRTQDSLEENVSSFYAELRRLRQLLTMLEAPQLPVLFMLDEILKGTNSHDRHHGAASLIKQLSKLEASGFVSTHDLELGKLADELSNIRNYSFTSTIEGDEIIFDYKLYEGVCQSFNASKLMEKMGIAIEKS